MADTTRSPPVPIKRTLVVVNDFCVSTTKFLNHFYALAEDRLGEVSRQIARVETALILAESRLARVPGMEEQYLAPPTSVSLFVPTSAAVKSEGGGGAAGAPSLLLASSLPPLPPLSTAAGGVAPPPLAPSGNGSSSAPPPPPPLAGAPAAGAAAAAPPPPPPAPAAEPPPPVPKLSEHPDYKPLFKMIQMGVPLPNVEQKARLLGLRPELLSNPNAPITVVGGGGGRDSDDGPPLPIMDAAPPPPPPAAAPAQSSLPPEYDTLIKMLKNGIPRGAVEQKAKLLGLDPSLLP